MKKEESQLEQTPKIRSIFRYQLKATNQILKDTLSLCYSSLLSTRPNKGLSPPEEPENSLSGPHSPNPEHRSFSAQPNKSKHRKQHISKDFSRQKKPKKQVFQQFGYIQSSFKRNNANGGTRRRREDEEFDASDFLNPNFLSFSEDQEFYRSGKPEKQIQSAGKKGSNQDNKRDLRKQRRGLAEISLKVKNIVARMGKMTFKEVSDEVLRESQDQLPNQPDARERETKNIRRRVYDALNVLVSVNILGKQQRCVVHTPATSIPGKKLSEHWQIISEKKRLLDERKSDKKKKQANLDLLKKNIEMMKLFHQRNQQILRQQQNSERMRTQAANQWKWHFPLVFLVPPKSFNGKVKVQLEYLPDSQENLKKITVDNNDFILTDLDVLKYLNLDGAEREEKIDSISVQRIEKSREEKEDREWERGFDADGDDFYLSE